MEPQSIWNVLLSAGMAAGGWVLRTLYSAIRDLEKDLGAHKTSAALTYATNADMARIEDKLDRILERIERKADR